MARGLPGAGVEGATVVVVSLEGGGAVMEVEVVVATVVDVVDVVVSLLPLDGALFPPSMAERQSNVGTQRWNLGAVANHERYFSGRLMGLS